MKRKQTIGKGAACLITVVLVATLILMPVGRVQAAKAYKVGAVFSVTGRASFLGDPEKKTALMLQEEINQKGGINGHPLELVIYDDEGDSTKCALAVRKLITRDKVCVIIGPSLSGLSLAVVPEAEKHEIPLISCAASYKIVTKNPDTGEQWKWVFKTPQSDSMAVEAIYTHMKKHGISKIAIMSVTSGFGASGRGELLRLAPKYGITIVADEKYGPKDTDMTAQLTKIKGLAPQAIVNWSIGPTQVVVVRNWKELDMTNITMYQSHGFGSRKNIKLAAGAAEGVYCPLGACNIAEILPDNHPQKQVTMGYLKAYKAKYNEPLSSFGGHAWDALSMVHKALEAVGPNKAKIRDYLENLKGFVGQHGVFNFSPKDHNGLTKEAFQMVVVKSGDWAIAD
ncbi:MAG: ABC transporter substrate-binding protein [Deltaproteobacteria bacterium]|nr:ABC transporter substrate-binding protein [Deltaproteobacteria bacterium]MBW2019402.1 ABC transporter substrate-binding protein [Deltaproteobacteria bacterium]MBW2074239.1 ABC transporter substrate-binding protein [Deltaproteobacteria bacterium]